VFYMEAQEATDSCHRTHLPKLCPPWAGQGVLAGSGVLQGAAGAYQWDKQGAMATRTKQLV